MYENPDEFVAERLRKRRALIDSGVDPYPAAAFAPTHGLAEARERMEADPESPFPVHIAGRIVARRRMGKVVFLDLLDDGARLQLFVRRAEVGEAAWRMIELLDLGDFLGASGETFFTRTGESSVRVRTAVALGKASHPILLPKQRGEQVFDAVADTLHRYDRRHEDLLSNAASRDVFVKRARVLRGIRRYLDDEGFLEVETPILGQSYGGASARPFATRLHAMDQSAVLRISPECALKRVLCGGINKVYELGKSFRNEGIDSSHNPEFTMVEWYEAWSDYREQMARFETLAARLCEDLHGTTKISYRGRPLDLSPPWRRLPMIDALRDEAGVDVKNMAAGDFPALFAERHPEGAEGLPEPLTWGAAIAELFEALVEPNLWDPVFAMDHPVEISPLTKRHRRDPRLVERFEPFVAGMEVGNAYSELNDPVEQYERLASQQLAREEAYDLDEAFLRAVADGMPPAGGAGMGVDRIVMILTGAESIRDVILFPFLLNVRTILEKYRKQRRTITYGELGRALHRPARGPWPELDRIAYEDTSNGKENLTYIVVSKKTELPAKFDGKIKREKDDWTLGERKEWEKRVSRLYDERRT